MLSDIAKPRNVENVEDLLREVIQRKIISLQDELDSLEISGDEGFPEFITKALAEHYIGLLEHTIAPGKLLYDLPKQTNKDSIGLNSASQCTSVKAV